MTAISKLGVRVETVEGGFRLTDHVGNVYDARPLGDGPTHGLTLVTAGKFPGFGRKDRVVVRDGVLCLIGR